MVNNHWLVVWNHGILWLSIQLGMSSSQLTNSIIFQRGRYTTNQCVSLTKDFAVLFFWGCYKDMNDANTDCRPDRFTCINICIWTCKCVFIYIYIKPVSMRYHILTHICCVVLLCEFVWKWSQVHSLIIPPPVNEVYPVYAIFRHTQMKRYSISYWSVASQNISHWVPTYGWFFNKDIPLICQIVGYNSQKITLSPKKYLQ